MPGPACARFAIIAFVILVPGYAPAASGDILAGDANESGSVDALDLQLIIRAIFGLDVGDSRCDVNYDGGVDALDLQLVIRVIFGQTVHIAVTVPDVTGLTQAEAEGALYDAGLTVGEVIEEPSDTAPAGVVMEQAPAADLRVSFNAAIDLIVSTGAPELTWFRWLPGPGQAVATEDGGFVVAAGYDSLGMSEPLILKFSATGDVLWRSKVGDGLLAAPYCIANTSDGGFVVSGIVLAGDDEFDVFIAKLDDEGDEQWIDTYGADDASEYAARVSQTEDGGFLLAGFSLPIALLPAPDTDIYLLKTAADGTVEWEDTYGSNAHEGALAATQTDDGGFLAGGWRDPGDGTGSYCYVIKTDGAGELQWYSDIKDLQPGLNGVAVTPGGGLVFAGSKPSAEKEGETVASIALMDSGSRVLWQRTHQGGGLAIEAVVPLAEGYAVCGRTRAAGAATDDIFLGMVSELGYREWTCVYGGPASESVEALVQGTDGGFALIGGGEGGVFILKTDAEGNAPPLYVE